MPQPTKAQAYSDLLFVAENLLAASIALADDLDDLDAGDSADEDFDADCLSNDVSDVLDLSSLNWMEIADYMMGDGSRGPYNKIPKVIEALIILHNMAIEFHDKPAAVWQLDEDSRDPEDEMEIDGGQEPLVYHVDGNAQVPAYETDNWLKEQGRRKRLELLDELF
ncbi:hypothetical protein FB451DRAFT_1415707 [Mycena latifolia]|nr:hypothetical protein FB451DRAFT_1415707 [Mycena latifolia]